jgi:hypothetical protein
LVYFELQSITSHKNDDKSSAHHSTTILTIVTQQASWVLQRATNTQQVENNWRKVGVYVKSNLFEKVVFVWEKSLLDRGGW